MPENARRYQASEAEWHRIAATGQFQELITTMKVFILPAFLRAAGC